MDPFLDASEGLVRAEGFRGDFAMLVGLLFLLIVGADPWSLDALRSTNSSASPGTLP